MKSFLCAAALLLAVVAPSAHAGIGQSFPRAIVTGTVTVEVTDEEGVRKPKTTLLDNQRIFEAFGFSPTERVLVITEGGLFFILKSGGGPNNNVVVFSVTETAGAKNDKKETLDFVGTIVPPQGTPGLFTGLKGTVAGRQFFGPAPIFPTLKVLAIGTNPSNQPPGSKALLKFNVRSGPIFTSQ